MSTRRRLFVPTILAAALAAPVTAGASPAARADEPAWGPVTVLAPTPWSEDLAVDAHGVTTVVWATAGSPGTIVAVQRGADGEWGARTDLGRGVDPVVVADGRGNVTAAWITVRKQRAATVVAAAARRPASGHWSEPVRISDPRTAAAGPADLDLAVGRRGDLVAAWAWGRERATDEWRIQAASRSAGGRWDDPVAVTPADGARGPQLAMSDQGALVVYGRQLFGHPQSVLSRERTAQGTWSHRSLVAREGHAFQLAADRAGDAVVAYSPDFSTVAAASRTVGGAWHRRALVPSGAEISDFALVMDPRGTATVALGRGRGPVDLITHPLAGSWSEPVRVVRSRATLYDVLLTVDRAGDLFLGWGGYGLYGTYRPAGGDWTARSTISPDAGVEVLEETHAGMAPDGAVAVLWKQEARPLKVRFYEVPAPARP